MRSSRTLAVIRDVTRLLWRGSSRLIKLKFAVVVVLVIAASILAAVGPVFIKMIVDSLVGHEARVGLSALLVIGAYTATQFLSRAISELNSLLYAGAERRMFSVLGERMFSHVIGLPWRFHLDRHSGSLHQTLENGLQGYELIVQQAVFTFLPVLAEVGTMIVVLARMGHPEFPILFCAALLSYVGILAYTTDTITDAAGSASEARAAVGAAIMDGVLNLAAVKCFVAEALVEKKVRRALARTESEWIRFYRRYAANGLVVALTFAVFLGVTAVEALMKVRAGKMSVGDFVLVNAYMLQAIRPLELVGYALQGVLQGVAMLRNVLSLFSEEGESVVPGERSARQQGPGVLEFRGISLAYRPDRPVLEDVSFIIPAGRTLGVVGASGSGKSSLVRLLVRLVEPDRGRILLDGVSIAELPLAELRSAIAVVPQETALFDDTIAYNIAFGKPGCAHEEVVEAARLAHLHDFIMMLPEKYETRVGERGLKLSGGERQRIAISRAAVKHPRIYVFDEATSALDGETERAILDSIREVCRSCTTLIIAHRLSTVARADEIIVLEGGAVVERGSHLSLLAQNGRYATVWAKQRGTLAA